MPLFDDSNLDYLGYLDDRMAERMGLKQHDDSVVDDHRPPVVLGRTNEKREVNDYLLARKLFTDHRSADVVSGILKDDPKEKPIAVRCVQINPKNVKHIARELAISTQCRSRSLLQYANGVMAGDVLFLELPFAQRLNELIAEQVKRLTGRLPQEGLFSEKFVVKLAYDVVAGLKDLHSLGFVHANVNPDNVLLGLDGNFMLTGLDLVYTHGDDDCIRHSAEIGTNMPAEQLGTTKTGHQYFLENECEDVRPLAVTGFSYSTDVWALGTLVFHTICGLPLFGFPNKTDVSVFLDHVTFAQIPALNAFRQPDGVAYSDALAELARECLHRDFNARPTASRLLHFAVFHGLRMKRYELRPTKYPLDVDVRLDENHNFRIPSEVFDRAWLKALLDGKTATKAPPSWKIETKPKPSKKSSNLGKIRLYIRVRDSQKRRIRYTKIAYDAGRKVAVDDQEVAETLLELLTAGLLGEREFFVLLKTVQEVLSGCAHCAPPVDNPNLECERDTADKQRLLVWVLFDEQRDPKTLAGCAQLVVEPLVCTCRR
ncbi:hypothetical protein M3Y99_01304000 [Aphelenchoides fujianensis]|nr:hypothetical protein M3Y99_01304000 [Aphelenchoides fujianensis]